MVYRLFKLKSIIAQDINDILPVSSLVKPILYSDITFIENLTNGISPKFHSDGFIKPDITELIVDGEYKKSLISPRSALEYSVNHNAAEYYESPVSIELKEGSIKSDEILNSLNNGIYISNLWYLNFSPWISIPLKQLE